MATWWLDNTKLVAVERRCLIFLDRLLLDGTSGCIGRRIFRQLVIMVDRKKLLIRVVNI